MHHAEDKAMLKGKEFGAAIGIAIKKKISAEKAPSKAAIARHFNMKPPSLSDWVKKGSVAKDKLPELWRYFSDVVGPEHWGMSPEEWPAGLTATPSPPPEQKKAAEPDPIYLVVKTPREKDMDELLAVANRISDQGMAALLFAARQVAEQFPKTKQTPKSSA